jgi:hypothetical protein
MDLFFKRDDGREIALTEGKMYFPSQAKFDAMAKAYVVSQEDTVNDLDNNTCSPLMTNHRKYRVRPILGLFAIRDKSSTGIRLSVASSPARVIMPLWGHSLTC